MLHLDIKPLPRRYPRGKPQLGFDYFLWDCQWISIALDEGGGGLRTGKKLASPYRFFVGGCENTFGGL
jgi:hypothetical protein